MRKIIILSGFLAISSIAQETNTAAILSHPPDKFKVSYALGLHLGLQLKHVAADVDANVIAQAIKDVMAGRSTQIQESEIQPLFDQANAYGLAKQGEKNKIQGAAFLAKNATNSGVVVLPDGLQYRVIKDNVVGDSPTSSDLVIVNQRVTTVDGTEIATNYDHMVNVGRVLKGCREALQMMKIGSKWQLFIPPDLAYGHEVVPEAGPEATIVLELELLSIESPPTGPMESPAAAPPINSTGSEQNKQASGRANAEKTQ